MSSPPCYRLSIKGIRRTVECTPTLSDTSWKKASDIMLVIGLNFCKSTECCFTENSLLAVITDFLNNTPNDMSVSVHCPSFEGVYLYNFMCSNRSELLDELIEKELVVMIYE